MSFTPSIWSDRLLNEFHQRTAGRPSLFMLELVKRAEHFNSVYKTGFLENIWLEENLDSLSTTVQLRFSKGRMLEVRYDEYNDAAVIMSAMLEQFTPEVLAIECLKVSAMSKKTQRPITVGYGVKTFVPKLSVRIK